MAFLVTEALADTPQVWSDSLMLPWDSLTALPDSLSAISGHGLADALIPLVVMAATAAVFALLFFVRSK